MEGTPTTIDAKRIQERMMAQAIRASLRHRHQASEIAGLAGVSPEAMQKSLEVWKAAQLSFSDSPGNQRPTSSASAVGQSGFKKREYSRGMAMDTRQFATAVRIFLQQGIDEGIMQMRLDGGTLEDCEAELHLLADFVRAQADGLRAEWPDMMRDTVLPTTANPGPRPR